MQHPVHPGAILREDVLAELALRLEAADRRRTCDSRSRNPSIDSSRGV